MKSTLIFALDRTGRLQTARWCDATLVGSNCDELEAVLQDGHIRTSKDQLAGSAGPQTYEDPRPLGGNRMSTHASPRQM